jgi:hypothetical protein
MNDKTTRALAWAASTTTIARNLIQIVWRLGGSSWLPEQATYVRKGAHLLHDLIDA